MLKNIRTYLLTNYPLLWNTRVVWILLCAAVAHLGFFGMGFLQVTPGNLQEYGSILSIGEAGMYTLTILSALCIFIVWLIFYLRNNAFKSFYIIDKFHSAKEFSIIVICIFSMMTFSESYQLGAVVKARSITSREELIREVNIMNQALAYIPREKQDYFKLTSCTAGDTRNVAYTDNVNYFDSTDVMYSDTDRIKIRKALREPDAFSYKNYCITGIDLVKYPGFLSGIELKRRNNQLIDGQQTDSIASLLNRFVGVCTKYHIDHKLSVPLLTSLVFKDSFHAISKRVRTYNGIDEERDSAYYIQTDYLNSYELERALNLVEGCYLNSSNRGDRIDLFFVKLYMALCAAILLLCFRLYSRKVFLISILGTVLWGIIFGLLGASGDSGESLPVLYMILFAAFLGIGIALLRSKGSKTLTGVLLNWHIFMVPFVIMILTFLIEDYFQARVYSFQSYYSPPGLMYDPIKYEEVASRFPISRWVSQHTQLLIRLNLLFVFLYVTFFFTRLSKKWHNMPEE